MSIFTSKIQKTTRFLTPRHDFHGHLTPKGVAFLVVCTKFLPLLKISVPSTKNGIFWRFSLVQLLILP